MRRNRLILVLLATGVFLVLVATFGIHYWEEVKAQEELNAQIAISQQAAARIPINELSVQQTNLKADIAWVQSQTAAIKSSLKQSSSGVAASRELFRVAGATGVEIVNISSSGTITQPVEKVVFDSLSMSVKVEGSFPKVLQFILDLGKSFPNGAIKSVELDITSSGKALANLTINIYTYEDE